MTEYFLKSAGSLLAFLLFYRFLLEEEGMHVFKRFYLLAALLLSHIIPFIVTKEYIIAAPDASLVYQGSPQAGNFIQTQNEAVFVAPNFTFLIWGIYLIGLLTLGLRYFRNIFRLMYKIKTNPGLKVGNITRILLREIVTPHTFLSYIFLNKAEYESRMIPEEVLLHEETHARQRHTLDVLFVELLQVIFWFNPLIYLFRKSIKLNHEFLADHQVLIQGVEPGTYLNMLLAYSGQDNGHNNEPHMANAFNHSSIKKRFTVMKTRTPKMIQWIKSLLLLPLTALLLYGFGTTRFHYEESDGLTEITLKGMSAVKLEIKKDLSLRLNDSPIAIDRLSAKILEIVSPQSIESVIAIVPPPGIDIPENLMNQLKAELGKVGIHTIRLITGDVQLNGHGENTSSVFAIHSNDQGGDSERHMETYKRLGGKYLNQPAHSENSSLEDPNTLDKIYSIMTPLQRAHTEPFLENDPKNTLQEVATRQMVEEYNSLARKYNNMPKSNYHIIGQEVERMNYIYNAMNADQKEKAEPFPEFTLPPSPPRVMATSPATVEVEVGITPSPASAPVIAEVSANLDAVPSVSVIHEMDERTDVSVAQVIDVVIDVPSPPPPPAPKSPAEFIEEMAGKNAIFYYEGQKISYKKALKLVRSSNSMGLRARHSGLAQPIVELYSGTSIIERE